MFNDRICQVHNLSSTAINLKAYKDENEGFLCAKCLTDQNNSDEVAHIYDIQSTIDDIVGLQISKQQQFTNHLISQLEELKNHLSQFQQSVNIIINKQLINIEYDQKELTQKLNHLENQENVRNDSFYLEFIKKNYKGKYVLQCSNKLDKENTDLMKNITEGIDQIIESEQKKKIYEQLNQIINECNQEEIITKTITQKINQKQKTITLSQDCPVHEQETTMIVLDKKCDRNRLICIDCIEECQQQGLKKFYSIKKVNQIWKDSKEKLSQSLSEILNKSQLNVKKTQEILQQQNNKFNESTEQLLLLIGQSFNEIKKKQQKVDEEKHINLQELESQELLNRITYLADGSYDTELIQIERLQENEQKQFINRVKEHSKVLLQLKNEYDQQIQSQYDFYKIEEQEPIDKKIDIFNDIKQCQEYFIKLLNQNPQIANITLEDCNCFIVDDKEYKNKIIIKWLNDSQNIENFRLFAIILVDQIKRQRLSFFKSEIMNLNKNFQFNAKQLFYLIFINSSEELKFQLLKNQIVKQSVPLIYLNPNLTQINNIYDLFLLNKSLFYLFSECYPIINLSFSKVHSSCGKTQIINQIFYKQEVFEVNDYCDSNLHSIDIMFDFCFSGSRNLAIADVHGIIPFEVMIKILPLFQLCIIQMNSEDELKENYEQFMHIKQKLQKWNSECCFIIRNSKTKDNPQLSQLEITVQNEGISIHKMIDLTQKGLDRQQINSEIESFSQFIFGKLKDYKSNLSNSLDFLTFLQNYYDRNDPEILKIQQDDILLESLMNELQTFITDPNCFYSLQAFPMRSLKWQINNLKQQQQYQFNGLNRDQQIQQVEDIKLKISNLVKQIPQTKPTRILELFQQIIDSKDYYNLYSKFAEQLIKINEQNKYQLLKKNYEINGELQNKQYGKKQTKNLNQDEMSLKEEIQSLKKQLEQNLKTIELRNIGIELFWRELIQIKQKGQSAQLRINPAKVVANMVKKGEHFEFLDGDQLEIETKFLLEFIKNFPDPYEKVLVLSILGPQSSGKSTILNKIFGCHFCTSVGRCTKGIYLQLLKITQKKYFDNQFDYVLILDTEGLQNPNQNDPEFDKKIALFILTISDIILLNVKGDIHQQFKNLVEMCIFTLGQMKSSISAIKQLSWCFNQNNDCKNFAPFLQQIQSIVNNLNLQINNTENEGDNSTFDYNEVLNIKNENIKILGFASTEQSWRVNSNTGIYDEWRQLIVNETFSEEAYIFGVQMIKQFVKKLKTQQGNSLQSLQLFVQNVESDWQSICRLPDLLEFTELLQYKQDLFMKQQIEMQFKKLTLNYHLEIPRKIQSEFPKGKINLDFFRQSEQQQKEYIKTEIQIIQNDLKEKLLQIKTQNQIQKKIYSKCIKILEERLKNYSYQCEFVILDEIKKLETDYQQKKGFLQIENLVSQISQDDQALQSLKGNSELIKQKFDAIWSNIIDQSIEQQENIISNFSIAQYKTIHSYFSQCNFKSAYQKDFQKDFQNKFLKEINKTSPFKEFENEKQQTYFIFEQEFKKQQQFICLQKESATIKYQDIFHQKIQDRLKKSSDQNIININHYYHFEVQLIHIQKQDFQDYLQLNIFEDFWNFVKQTKKKYQYKDGNVSQIVSEFFQLLIFCSVSYDLQQYQILIQWMEDGWSWKLWKNEEELLKDQFEKLQKTFKFDKNKEIYVESLEHSKYLSFYYPNLRCEKRKYYANDEKDIQDLISEQQKQSIVFLFSKEIIPKKQKSFQTALLYINDQQKNYQIQNNFNQNGVKLFELIMDEQKGWIKLYSQIYDIIKLEMVKSNQKILQFDCIDEEEIVSSNMNLIQIIMSKIQQKIIEFNKEFSNFGVILKDDGERCIYYYSIFIIWRFQCYKEWRSLEENQWRLKKMKDEQLQKFTAAIEQNKSEQSIISAQALAKNIKQGFLNRFYQDNLEQISKSIMSYNMSCYDFVKQLDREILEQTSKSQQYSDDDILNYIVDQKQFIEKQVDLSLLNIEKKVKTEFENQLRDELKQYMKLIFHNIEIIYKYISPQIEPVKSEEYFDYNEAELNTQNCESQLFQLIQNCIQGDNFNQVNAFKVNYNFRDIFEIKQYSQVRVPIFFKTYIESEELIKLLKPFIQELYIQIKNIIEKSDNEQIKLRNDYIQHCWNKLKLDMNGCQHSCPMCKRKCDQPYDNNHKHTCRNGHQLRGMNGVIINNYPSLFTCEEIPEEAKITTLETNIVKKWREIQKAYNDWIFKDLKENEIKVVKEKMMNVWNHGIGQLVCNYLKVKLKNENIIFKKKSKLIDDESIHYIIMLEDFDSMIGRKWERAKQGVFDCMREIEKNPYAKLSVIIFNRDARVVINCEKVDIKQQQGKFNYNSGGTDFSKAFKLAYTQFNAYNYLNFSKTIFLFYSDGGAAYPDQEVTQFCNLPIEKKRTISLIYCSETELRQNGCLIKITEELKKNQIFADLKSNVKVDDIQKVFTEIVSQSYHNLKC